MGFYLDFSRDSKTPYQIDYREASAPAVYWILFAFSGFAITCMALAATSLLRTLASDGSPWDRLLVAAILSFVPFWLLVGVRMAGARKFLRLREKLELGFRLFGRDWIFWSVRRDNIASVSLSNHRPSRNLAPAQHGDPQYYVRGHWRVEINTKDGRKKTVDRHTEREALSDLENDLKIWLNAGAAS